MNGFVLALCTLFLKVVAISPSLETASLVLKVKEVKVPLGVIRVAVYNHKASFLKFKEVFSSAVVPAVAGETKIVMEGLPPGTYALALYQDLNNNGKMDKNWIGIPTEPLGFSNAKLGVFGPPSFKACTFEMVPNVSKEISITLENNK